MPHGHQPRCIQDLQRRVGTEPGYRVFTVQCVRQLPSCPGAQPLIKIRAPARLNDRINALRVYYIKTVSQDLLQDNSRAGGSRLWISTSAPSAATSTTRIK